MRAGVTDIVIGTHRLVQKDVAFKDLGLVIIDEEQRFGVEHKERLKSMKQLVDVLTLTATPIPRTLYLSLTGVREISVIQTPPQERRPIETIIARDDDALIRAAILRELNRGGQVYFLYNRVMTIDLAAERLRRLAPEARLGVGHGQMAAGDLKRVVRAFTEGRLDILLCTTIIESGVDIANANTIIIDRADRFGMADLYQLRGRVGRAGRKAYAYLLLPARGHLFSDARRRLGAIVEYSGAGAGFRLALRDLEIRGAGNLLGAAQSGHIAAVGFELYCRLLRQAVAAVTGARDGAAPPPIANVELNLDFIEFSPLLANEGNGAFLPSDYIEDERLRLEFFRKLASAGLDELPALRGELADRFGPLPQPVERLLQMAVLRQRAAAAGIVGVEVRDDRVMLRRGDGYIQEQHQFPRLRAAGADARLVELTELIEKLCGHGSADITV
jgi:transcription-repair coupling factor (superfamily II helicase)